MLLIAPGGSPVKLHDWGLTRGQAGLESAMAGVVIADSCANPIPTAFPNLMGPTRPRLVLRPQLLRSTGTDTAFVNYHIARITTL